MGVHSCVFFFKQKTAYELRSSDWSSDVCSSDLLGAGEHHARPKLDLLLQRLVVDPVIALEGDAVDDRVLGNHHDEVVALALQAHVGKEPGGEEVLQGDRKSTRLNSSH